MTTAHNARITDVTSVFHGQFVHQLAGLEMRPDAVCPRFEDEVWDLTGLAKLPRQVYPGLMRWDFRVIDHGPWRWVGREVLIALLAPPVSFNSIEAAFVGGVSGAAVLVALGAPSRRPTPAAVESGLAGRFHVVGPDMRGHGDSDRVGGGGYYH